MREWSMSTLLEAGCPKDQRELHAQSSRLFSAARKDHLETRECWILLGLTSAICEARWCHHRIRSCAKVLNRGESGLLDFFQATFKDT